jgi:hypothetical protein
VDGKPPIHIESTVTTAGARTDPTSGPWSSTNRVVRGPGRPSRLAAGVAAAVLLLAGGLLWWANDGEGENDSAGKPACGIGEARVRAARIASGSTHGRLTVDGHVVDLPVFRRSAGQIVPGPTAVLRLDPRAEAPDAAGRCVIRITVPAADRHDGFGERLVGANLLLTLDEDGNIARIVVRSAPYDPQLVLERDTREGERQAVVVPPDSGR